MPSLKKLLKIKNQYPSSGKGIRSHNLEQIMEAFSPKRVGRINPSTRTSIRSFSEFNIDINNYINYFKNRKKVEVVLLFIDISLFSERFKNKPSEQLAYFLDEYYEKVIPIIGEYGGEIEKIIGDGIICVFGEPFLSIGAGDLHLEADKCARKIISELKDTDFESKIALNYGEIMYYQNKSDEYYEFTMIGNALTELFRLESVSDTNSINFFDNTIYYKISMVNDVNKKYRNNPLYSNWELSQPIKVDLKGVSQTSIRNLTKI